MFVASDDSARAKAIFTSLVASCQMHGIEPRGYLRDRGKTSSLAMISGFDTSVFFQAPKRASFDSSSLATTGAHQQLTGTAEPADEAMKRILGRGEAGAEPVW